MMAKQKLSTKIRVHRNTNDGSHVSSDSATVIDPVLLDEVSAFVDDAEAWFNTPNEEIRLRNRIQAARLGLFS